mmetsp:Transcript_118587/g.332062  ORF Transcript_118587/g.332062 Transcript_118587/m.332062 type:complete len:598 (-) Transcript_118587:483-2276(-)
MKTKMSADDDAVATSTTSTDREGREAIGKKRMSRKDRKEAKRLKKKDSANLPFVVSTPDENYLASYEPVNIPTQPSEEVSEASNSQKQSSKGKGNRKIDYDDEGGEGNCSATLGKWFPHALLIKCPVNYTNTGQLLLNSSHLSKEDVRMESPLASLVLFYQYSSAAAGKQWTPTQVKLLMTYLSTVARRRNLGGRIRVATEGVNATISAVDMPDLSAREALRHFAQDLKRFDPAVFDSVDFKYIDDLPADRHFKELRIIPVQELVFYDIRESDAPLQPDNQNASGSSGGIHLEAKEYHEMLKKENAVVIDVRNHYETIIGRFDGQESVGGARYIDPKMRKSTDFKGWLAKDETKEKLKNKTVLMFCTGGIRCERASAYLKNKLGNEVEEVYQLAGGIERYLQAYPGGGGFFQGKNFVFDKRESVSATNPNGDGGVVVKAADREKSTSQCCVCACPWDRYIGKKKCWTCGVPVLMCDRCLSKKPDKDPKTRLSVRCPLCVTENVTVPASEVEFTANGIKGKNPFFAEKGAGESIDGQKKAAESVLKWGGGHASKKKIGRQMKRRACKFGVDCNRSDCFFAHPEREQNANKRVKAQNAK